MEYLSKSTIPVTLNVCVVKIFSNTMFLLIVLQEENPLSIAKFYTIAKSFSIFYFFSFLVVSLLLLFFSFRKMKRKSFLVIRQRNSIRTKINISKVWNSPAGIYLLKVNKRNTRRRWETCSQKDKELRYLTSRYSGV